MTKNDGFRWIDNASFAAAGFTPRKTRDARSAYVGIPRRVLLTPGEPLYRFQEGRWATHGGQVSPWWLPIQSVEEIHRLQKVTELSFEEVVRSVTGLAFDFQLKCDVELTARLMRPVYGFRGPIARQPLLVHPYSKTSKETNLHPGLSRRKTVSGYLEQFFIPHLILNSDVSVRRRSISLPVGGFSILSGSP